MFTLYSADFINAPSNCSYPHKTEVMDAADLAAAVSRDYVCAEYMNHYRNGENFLGSDCLPVDCDNDHSENLAEWVTPADVQAAFPGITFAVHYSRFHMREKNGKPARPKFHVLFPIECMTDPAAYSEMKKLVNTIFPYFDTKALDAARFFFGTADPQVEIIPGEMTLSEYLSADDFDADMPGGSHGGTQVIAEGSRNATMSRFAGRVIKKYGDNDTAFQCFMEEAEKCTPPLEQQELMTIWHSAQKFYAKVQQQDGYVPPELYNDDTSYKPDDFSDVGQAEVLAKHFSGELRYSPATHYIRYNGRYWQETEPGAQAVAHELTRRQLKEASSDMMAVLATLKACGAQDILDNNSKAKAEGLMSDEQLEAYQAFLSAKAYQSYVIQRRASKNITATLKESRPMLEITPQDLDANPYLLCTPDATYDLRLGMAGAREHSPEDFITKTTTVSPGDRGKQIWLDCLDTIFCGDQELIGYVQMICGLAAIGKVEVEALIIAYGCGRNGKSTFWNSVSRVLGLYSGNISADTLTFGCRRNVKPEMAEVKGKRLLIAAEMQEGARLNDSTVKQLCSTDDIFAEKKYKDPFSFSPSHSLVLYTNHLPKVSASDDGTWRRLIVIPFNAKIEGKSDMSDGNRKLTVIYPRMTPEENQPKRRIAAYCRVSTQAEEQSHSLAAQISYYTKMIEEDPNAVLVDIYADRGTSGTRTRNRTNFLRLIEDCRAGKVDAIITKSVSRFGRNTVDTLVFTRELRSLGIDVYFEKENLHTCSAEGELLLTLMAAVAESESVSMSDNIKWGKRKRYEKGIIESLVIGTMLGFQQQDGEISIVEEEAAIVRMIYDWFLEGHGYEYITNRLIADNVPTKRPGAKWANTTIKNILTNEKYCGDCLFQKTFISDPIQHTSSRNRGQLPQYYIEDVLPAIISKEEWQAAQELAKRHAGNGLKQSETYPFTNMLVCPYCGKKYGGYTNAGHNRELLNWYRCKSRHDHSAVEVPGMIYTPPSRHRVDNPSPAMVTYREKYNHPTPPRKMICSDIRIPFAYPQKVYVRAWNQLVSKKTRYQPILQRTIETTDNALTRLRAKEMIGLLDTVGRLDGFDYALMLQTLDFIEVHSEEKMTVVFQSGIRISVK